ncbi:MAG: hypothetical protein H8E45_04445 [Proteobacteria bacterium]|nr:hypothetical protein [Pseudomonadota bacterium]
MVAVNRAGWDASLAPDERPDEPAGGTVAAALGYLVFGLGTCMLALTLLQTIMRVVPTSIAFVLLVATVVGACGGMWALLFHSHSTPRQRRRWPPTIHLSQHLPRVGRDGF